MSCRLVHIYRASGAGRLAFVTNAADVSSSATDNSHAVTVRHIKLEAGETVVVCPATGGFGGANMQVAVATGREGHCYGSQLEGTGETPNPRDEGHTLG